MDIIDLSDEYLQVIGNSPLGFDGSVTIEEAGPTPEPIPVPDTSLAGAMWYLPHDQIVDNGTSFLVEVHLNSGIQYFAAYGVDILYDSSIISYNSYSIGAQGFVSALNVRTPDVVKISGFDAIGKGPGLDLHVLTIHWTAVAVGETVLGMEIDQLSDQYLNNIGKPTPNDGRVIVQ